VTVSYCVSYSLVESDTFRGREEDSSGTAVATDEIEPIEQRNKWYVYYTRTIVRVLSTMKSEVNKLERALRSEFIPNSMAGSIHDPP